MEPRECLLRTENRLILMSFDIDFYESDVGHVYVVFMNKVIERDQLYSVLSSVRIRIRETPPAKIVRRDSERARS